MTPSQEDLRRLQRLATLVRRARGRKLSRVEGPIEELPRLYRHASSLLARLESGGGDARRCEEVRALVARAHALLFAPPPPRGSAFARAARFLAVESPRAIRAEWRLLVAAFVAFYGLALGAYLGVRADLDLAFSLMDGEVVAQEIEQLETTEEGASFRGNFDFGLGESPRTAGWIMVHNMGVGVLFFASALLPPIYLLMLATNALMVGTYTGVASHWGQDGAISSILWCHGTIELQTILLAGIAGAVLVRALVRPGPWTRRHALTVESRRAWCLLAPVFPLLFVSGVIEGWISPHAPADARLAVAAASGAALVLWVLLGGRGGRRVSRPARRARPTGGAPPTPRAAS